MQATQNIPERFPDWVDEEDQRQILEWIRSRSAHGLDTCVDRWARWTYVLTDHGIFTDVKVRDNTDSAVFRVKQNPDLW